MLTKEDLQAIEAIIDNNVGKLLLPIKKDIQKLKKDNQLIIRVSDNHYLNHEHRICRLEKELHIDPLPV